jgi:lysophospholipase L1-like esterase
MAALALFISFCLSVILVEGTLRLFDPIGLNYEGETLAYFTMAIDYEWQSLPPAPPQTVPEGLDLDGRLFAHKPDLDVSIGSFSLRTNSLRCRGPKITEAKPDDVFRVVVLGDSVAFGWGVDDEVTFLRRLEREWNAAGHRQRLEVINTAHPKYDSNQEAAMLRQLGLKLQPDLVLLVYVTNDMAEPTRDLIETLLTGVVSHADEQVVIPDDAWSSLEKMLQPLLPATAKLFGARTDLNLRVNQHIAEGERYAPERFGAGPRGWQRSQAALLDIKTMCKQADIPFVLFDHTLPRAESLRTFCEQQGIDYEPFWWDEQDLALGITNSWLDSHANARGHDLMLDRLRAALEKRDLLPRD